MSCNIHCFAEMTEQAEQTEPKESNAIFAIMARQIAIGKGRGNPEVNRIFDLIREAAEKGESYVKLADVDWPSGIDAYMRFLGYVVTYYSASNVVDVDWSGV